jgi:hypothetical protein
MGVHVESRTLAVAPATTENVDLRLRFGRAGSYLIRVVASGTDAGPIHADTSVLEIVRIGGTKPHSVFR